jgi:hypothetical protein
MAPWKVFAIVFAGAITLVGGGCAALIARAGTFDLSNLTLGSGIHLNLQLHVPDFMPKATKAELAEAATTVPPTHADCVAYQRVGDAGTTAGELNFADPNAHFGAYRARLLHVLYVYDIDLRGAIARAHGPLRTLLVKAEHAIAAGLVQLDHATTPRQYDALSQAGNGYDELTVAQQLLLGHCGRGVEPNADKALNATGDLGRFTTTTRPS